MDPRTDVSATPGTPRCTMHDTFRPGYGILVPAIGFCLLAVFGWLYLDDPKLYTDLLTYWMVAPFRFPFLDLAFISANISCWQQGVDVYAHTPCDVLGRTFDYSPLWLRFDFIPTDPVWTPWLGLALVSLFLLSLGFLPQPRDWRNRALVVFGTFSSMPVYCIERGNSDLLVFLLVVISALCVMRGFAMRLLGYAIIMVAAALKFYPLVLLLLLLRERLRTALLIGSIALLCSVAFVWWYASELVRAVHNIARGQPFGDTWGAVNLPFGFTTLHPRILKVLHLYDVMGIGLLLLLTAGAFSGAILIAMRQDVRANLAAMPARARLFLLLGAIMMCGCFFGGQSIGYRAVHLLFVLPGLLGLASSADDVVAARIFRLTAYATLYLLWMLLIQEGVALLFGGSAAPPYESAAGYVAWYVHQVIWWWVITVLLAILLRLGLDSPTGQDLVKIVHGIIKSTPSPAPPPRSA
jgi:hypothetical protein